jgi:hypothetical protein
VTGPPSTVNGVLLGIPEPEKLISVRGPADGCCCGGGRYGCRCRAQGSCGCLGCSGGLC